MEPNYIEEGNYVRWHNHDPVLHAKIISIEESGITIKTIPDGTTRVVQPTEIGYITTLREHLLRLGFDCKEINLFDYYVKGDVIISGIRISRPMYDFSSGFRLVPNFHPWIDVEKYVVDNRVDRAPFDRDFYELNELNRLLKLLQERKMAIQPIEVVLGYWTR